MLVAVHIAIAIASLLLAARLLPSAKSHLPIICLLLAMGLLHGLIPAVTPPTMRTMESSGDSRLQAAWFSLIGILALAIGYELYSYWQGPWARRSSLLDSYRSPSFQRLLRYYFWISLVLGLVGASLYMKSAGVGILDYAQAGRFEFRHFRNRPMMWAGLYLFHMIFAPGFLAQFMPTRYRVIGSLFAVWAAGIAFFFLFKGTRHVSLGIVSAVIIGYVLANRLSLRRVVIVGMTGLMLIVSTVALYEVRKDLNSVSVWRSLSKMTSSESLCEPLTRDPLNYHEHFVGAVEYFPAEHPYMNGATYRRMLTFYLPGPDYPVLKPEHPPRVFADVVYGDIYDDEFRATHPPSLLGDAYLNFWGWPGLACLVMNGFVIAWVTQRMRRSPAWFVSIGPHLGWFILLAPRGDPYVFFLMALFLVVLSKVLVRLIGEKHPARRRAVAPAAVAGVSQRRRELELIASR